MGPKMRMTTVTSVTELSPHMKRIIVSGDDLKDFPEDKKSAHVKAIFPDPNSAHKTPKLGLYFGFKKWMRSYTVREFNKERLELTLDFAVNDHKGLATNWAVQAKPGDKLGIAGPGEPKHTNLQEDNHLFFGDITALPAIAATLEQLPASAKGKAWIQVPTELDKQSFIAPKDIEINWLVTPNKLTDKFLNAFAAEPEDLMHTAIFIATEMSIVKQLKQHLQTHCNYDKKKLYASAYWDMKK
ncbi:siderophore-interacting protein [Colwellia sp. E2M01]|uniref:siderophore-interacting protein n=1 Tax=Colwellia sp. E2M01 TaxID=2841561 RepID=UPI001C089C0B|nr:siderophore-interacting protein [Colwellia sp. E2M01]MBU2872178.1 siderophore-interacting protein [Colwellia sp. E2M01]